MRAFINISSSNLTTRSATPLKDQSTTSLPNSIRDSASQKSRATDTRGTKSSYNQRKRVCFCDRYECPADCDKCDAENNSPCDHHQLIKCASISCRQYFHRCCIESIGFIQTEGYTCLKCTSN
mgnify:FL=1